LFVLAAGALPAQVDWRTWAGGNDGNRFSPLTQITKGNVSKLKVAWEYHSGDADARGRTMIQCTPLVIGGVLYGTTPTLMAVALDAATGKELWRFDPEGVRTRGVNRGVMYWESGEDKRILYSAGSYLFALNAKTGKLIGEFGAGGRVDMTKELDRENPGAFNGASTPGVVYQDLVIMGSSVGEGPRASAPGHIRAYDARTGKRRWIFHTIPHPGEPGYETWPKDAWKTAGGANNWGGMSLD
jgi:quinoprotein glucose dehydrogenase